MPDAEGKMAEREAEASSMNNFQGRYIILHPWEGEMKCESPMRGHWGGPPGGGDPGAKAAGSRLGGGVSGKAELSSLVKVEVPSIGLSPAATPSPPAPLTPAPDEVEKMEDENPGPCGTSPAMGGLGLVLAALLGRWRR